MASPPIPVRDAGDAALVLGIARYRQEALAEVYRRHAGAVYALVRRVTGDTAIAEEVVQEVLLRLWSEPDRFDSERGSLRSYLLTRAHSRAIDLLRSESSRRRRETGASQGSEAGYDVEREVWDLAVAEHVREALGTLPPDERDAIELAYFGGHSYRAVAQMLDEPEGTVKSRIRAGLRRLRTQMQAAGVVGTEA